MKKFISATILLVLAIGLYWFFNFYQKNLAGAWPVLKDPPKDIAKIIETNSTGLPLKLPRGFSVSIFAKNLENPRVLLLDRNRNMLTSIPGQGKVVALLDENNDDIVNRQVTIANNLNHPHGLELKCEKQCKLYIAESDQVSMWDYDEKNLIASNKKIIFSLPDNGGHVTRTIIFLPDGKLLTSVGSSCNVCDETDWQRAKILVSDENGKNLSVFAEGLRNSVFMALHPITQKIWATEMGRDLIGDDIPPDEINIIEKGDNSADSIIKNYGWPICYGKNIHDADFDKKTYIRNPCLEPFETSSHIDIPAHSAPLGLAFFPSEGWPDEYHGDLLIAYHGSWNKTTPTGYKIVRIILDENGNLEGFEDFITGWLTADGALGRPVDILIQPNGKIFISDDKAGVIYLVRH